AVEEIPRRGPADLQRLARLRAALRRCAPHVLHTIMWSGNSYGRLAALGLAIPVVIAAEHCVMPYRRWQLVVERALARMTDAHLINCEAIAAWQVERERLARGKIEVIPNGIDLGRLPAFSLDRRAARLAAGLGGCRELVTNGETGLLAPPRAPAAVAVAVARVLGDPALARRLATAARRRVEGAFSVEVMARRTMDAYLRLLHATRGPATVAAACAAPHGCRVRQRVGPIAVAPVRRILGRALRLRCPRCVRS